MLNHYQPGTSPSNHLGGLNWKSPAASQTRVLPSRGKRRVLWGGRHPPRPPTHIPRCPFTPGQDPPGPWKPSQGSRPTGGPPQLRHPPRGRLPETATARIAARMEWSPPARGESPRSGSASARHPPPGSPAAGIRSSQVTASLASCPSPRALDADAHQGPAGGAATGQPDGDARPRDPPGAAQLTAAPAPALAGEFPRPRPLGHAPGKPRPTPRPSASLPEPRDPPPRCGASELGGSPSVRHLA